MASGQLVNLDVSRDGGVTWSSIATSVANATATTGTFDWVVTGPATSTARVRVSWASDTAANDASNVNFSIVTPSIAVTAPNTAVTWRAGNTQTLRFTHNLGTGQPVAFDVSRDGGSTWTPIISLTTTTSNAVTYAWVVSGPPTPLARIRARWTSDPGVFDVSDVNFAIISRITVTAPNTAVTWGAGSTRQVTWTHNLGLAETVNIDVSPDGGATWVNVAAGVPNATATSGSFAALMPGSVTTQALLRVSQTTDPTSFDTSDVQFTLAAPVITVTAPNTNVNWPIGSTRSISWSHNLGTGEAVEVALSRDNGATWAPLTSAVANTGNTTGTFSWVVTGPATTTGRVRVTWMRNGAVQDVSNVAFRIQ